jgi:site-specific recombinase XerC
VNDLANGKAVQTELDEKEYEFLVKAAKKRKLTIKEGVREAVQHWISTQIAVDEDPLFNIEPVNTGVKTNSSKLDKVLYGEIST